MGLIELNITVPSFLYDVELKQIRSVHRFNLFFEKKKNYF